MGTLTKKVDNLLQNPTKTNLFLINTIFPQVIPFNRPHKFKIQQLDPEKTVVFAPLIRNNKNHLGTFHAIAQATIGELAAGMCLLRNFGMNDYRFILANIEIEYTYQAKTDLISTCEVADEKISQMKDELESGDKSTIKLETIIKDKNDNIVSKVLTTWQLKKWSKVRTNKQ